MKSILVVFAFVVASIVAGFRTESTSAASSPTTVQSIQVGDRIRTYRLHVPANPPEGALPLVLNFHGRGSNGAQQEALTGMSSAADNLGFAVVYPDGVDKAWHYGVSDIDDVDFVNTLVDRLVQTQNVDPRRVFASGISDGAFFSEFLACNTRAHVTAIAPVSASMTGLMAYGCASAPAVPVLVTFGTEDPIVPWYGSTLFPGRLWSVPDSISFWASHLGVASNATVDEWLPDADASDGTRVHHLVYGDGQLQLYAIEGGGHTWPGGFRLPIGAFGRTSDDYSATEVILNFFAQTCDVHRPGQWYQVC